MNDAIIINDSYCVPDKYKLKERDIVKRHFFFFWTTLWHEKIIELKSSGKVIVLEKTLVKRKKAVPAPPSAPKFDALTGEALPEKVEKEEQNEAVDKNEWRRIITLAERKYTIFLYEKTDGTFRPLNLDKEKGRFSEEMIDTDLWRHFKKSTKNVREIARNKWGALQKLIVLGLFGILALASVIVVFVLLNNFGIEHTTILRGVTNTSAMGGGWLNATTSAVLGG